MQQLKIFVISLSSATERRKAIKKDLNDFNLEFEFVDAVYGKALDANEKLRVNPQRNLKDGEVGCYLSHMLCYEKMLHQGLDHAIILEDDTQISAPLKEFAHCALQSVDFDILFLLTDDRGNEGFIYHIEKSRIQIGGIDSYLLTNGPYCTNAYVVSKKWASYRVSSKTPFSKPIDHYSSLARRPQLYSVSPSICYMSETAVMESMIASQWSPFRAWVQRYHFFTHCAIFTN